MTYNEKSIDYACNTACKDCLSTTCDKESIFYCKYAYSIYKAHLAGIRSVQDELCKMKNCANCKYGSSNGCKLGSKNYWCNRDKWELKE